MLSRGLLPMNYSIVNSLEADPRACPHVGACSLLHALLSQWQACPCPRPCPRHLSALPLCCIHRGLAPALLSRPPNTSPPLCQPPVPRTQQARLLCFLNTQIHLHPLPCNPGPAPQHMWMIRRLHLVWFVEPVFLIRVKVT